MLSDASIAELVQARYARLPKTGKPQRGEWTVLAGVVHSQPSAAPQVVALGTGTKCLSASAVAEDSAGGAVHDTHAEVCARRALLAWLLAETRRAASGADDAAVVGRAGAGFELRAGHALHLYTSDPPCGDAAIFGPPPAAAAVAATSNGSADADAGRGAETGSKRPRVAGGPAFLAPPPAHRTGAKPADPPAEFVEAGSAGAGSLPGLARTKPGRGERTCCMSCSDKLARWGAMGLQGGLLALLLPSPIHFASITVGEPCSLEALRRALARGARASPAVSARELEGSARGAEVLPPPEAEAASSSSSASAAESSSAVTAALPRLGTTTSRFEHAAPRATHTVYDEDGGCGGASSDELNRESTHDSSRPCSNALMWAASGTHDCVNGLSGKRLGANRKAPSPKHRSSLCKAGTWTSDGGHLDFRRRPVFDGWLDTCQVQGAAARGIP